AGNRARSDCDPTAHAESVAIRTACRLIGSERLIAAYLYVTLEPSPICVAAFSFELSRRLYSGSAGPKAGGVEHGPRVFSHATFHHRPEVYPRTAEPQSAALLRRFFAGPRD